METKRDTSFWSILLAAVLASALVLAGLAVLFRAKKALPPIADAERSEKSGESGEPAKPIEPAPVIAVSEAPPTAGGTDAPPSTAVPLSVGDESRWQNAVDLLQAYRAARAAAQTDDDDAVSFSSSGVVELPCVSAKGDAAAASKFFTDSEYDLRIVFERGPGSGGIVQTLCLNNKHFHFALGGADNTSTGFELVDGRKLEKNATLMKRAAWIDTGRKYVSIVQVRRHSVRAYLDGKFISDWNDLIRLSPGRGPKFADGAIGVTFFSAMKFYKIELLPIDRAPRAQAYSAQPDAKYGSDAQHSQR